MTGSAEGHDMDIDLLFSEIREELSRVRAKFPGDNVRKEAVQVAVMAMRVVLDGDSTLSNWRRQKGLEWFQCPPNGFRANAEDIAI